MWNSESVQGLIDQSKTDGAFAILRASILEGWRSVDGLDRLIEMLEKRFGKPWADGLLLLAVLGAAAWGLHTFVVDFVRPTYGYLLIGISALRGHHVSFTKEDFANLVFQIAWGSGSTLLFLLLYHVWIAPRLRATSKRRDELVQEMEDLSIDVKEGIDALRKGIDQAKQAGVDVSAILVSEWNPKHLPIARLPAPAPPDTPIEK